LNRRGSRRWNGGFTRRGAWCLSAAIWQPIW
jgi:hypothetical protein